MGLFVVCFFFHMPKTSIGLFHKKYGVSQGAAIILHIPIDLDIPMGINKVFNRILDSVACN